MNEKARRMPGPAAHAALAVLALLLTACVAAGFTIGQGVRMVQSESLLRCAVRMSLSTQMERIESRIDEVSQAWSLDASKIKATVTRQRLEAHQDAMIAWFLGLLQGRREEIPGWDTDDLVDVIRSDPAFVERVPEVERRTVARDQVAAQIARTIERTVFPLRSDLLALGERLAEERVNIPWLMHLFRLAPLLLMMASLALCGVMALFSLRFVPRALAFIGSSLVAAAMVMLLAMGLVCLLDVPSIFGILSPALEAQASALFLIAGGELALVCAALIAAGAWLICVHQRRMQRLIRREEADPA